MLMYLFRHLLVLGNILSSLLSQLQALLLADLGAIHQHLVFPMPLVISLFPAHCISFAPSPIVSLSLVPLVLFTNVSVSSFVISVLPMVDIFEHKL